MYHIEVELQKNNDDRTIIQKSSCVISKIENGTLVFVDSISSYMKSEVIDLVEKYVPDYFTPEYQLKLYFDKVISREIKSYLPKIDLKKQGISQEDIERFITAFNDIDSQVTEGVIRFDYNYNENAVLSKLIGRALKIKEIEHKENYFDEIKSLKFYLQSPKFGILHNYYYNDILVLITEMDIMGFRYQIPTKEVFLTKKEVC